MSYILLTWLLVPVWWLLAQVRKLTSRTPHRILIVEIAGIGDVICSTAVFKAVREQYPKAHIALMVDTVVADLAKQDPNLDDVISFSYSAQRGLRGRVRLMRVMLGYDTVICLIPSAAQLTAACWAAIPRRYSVLPGRTNCTYQWLSPLMTYVLAHRSDSPFVGTQLRLLKPLGIQQDDLSRHIYVQESSRHHVLSWLNQPAIRWVGLAIGSGQGIKAIQPDVLQSLIEQLLKIDGIGVVLIGGVKEAALAQRIDKCIQNERLVNAAGQVKLADLPALIERLSVFVGVDSGVTYMADALNIPMVYLPGPANPKDQRPIKAKCITLEKHLPCAPCSRVFVTPTHCVVGTNGCIASFTVNDILHAVVVLLKETECAIN